MFGVSSLHKQCRVKLVLHAVDGGWFVLQSPLDLLDLRCLITVTPYALCFRYILWIIPYAQQLVSWTIIAISPVHTATT
jgi:hypothetical protein